MGDGQRIQEITVTDLTEIQPSGEPPWLHCNACGRKVPIRRAMGSRFSVCSRECIHEMEWRHASFILGKPHTPSPESVAWAKKVLGEDETKEPRT